MAIPTVQQQAQAVRLLGKLENLRQVALPVPFLYEIEFTSLLKTKMRHDLTDLELQASLSGAKTLRAIEYDA